MRIRAIEQMLVADYEDARADLISESSAAALNRCTLAMRRLRMFLSHGEIPEDFALRFELGTE